MRTEKIASIIQSVQKLNDSANNLLSSFNAPLDDGSVTFDIKAPIFGSDVNFVECMSRIMSVSQVVERFEKTNNHIMVPLPRLTHFEQSIISTQQYVDALISIFQQMPSTGGILQITYDTFQAQQKNGQTIDLRSPFKSFTDSLDQLLESFFQVLVIIRPTKATYSFQAAANSLSNLVASVSGEMESLRKEVATLRKQASASEALVASTKESAEESARIRDESAKDRKTVSEYLSEATDKKTSIDSVHLSATSLENEVAEFREKFEAFDRQIEKRTEDFTTGSVNQATLFESFSAQEAKFKELINQSENMLKGATVAGLASSFSNAHKDLGNQLFWARLSFYFGILFLFVSAIPLMFYVFLPIIAPLLKSSFPAFAEISASHDLNQTLTGWQYIGQVLARFIILLPAAWFVSFSAIRHSSLFRLREHYAYKYSMAVSVEGFRKQAPGYESEIAALVLEQLAFNPADKLIPSKDIREGKVPHPMLDLLLNKFRTGLDRKE